MLFIYRLTINLFFPIIVLIIFLRRYFNKEDKIRYKEKLFLSSIGIFKKSNKKLIWFHAASIGELKSIIPIIKKLNKKNKFKFLVTTITLSSSKLFHEEKFNNENVLHRFFPIDKPNLINKFLDHWNPILTVFVDSEIWPNFLLAIKKRKIPLIFLNGRITKKTFLRWNFFSYSAKKIFKTFDLCLPSSNESKKYLKKLNVKNIKYFGNLKLSSENKSINYNFKNKSYLKNKKWWCAISTHKDEDIFCLKTHLKIKLVHKEIVTIIIPRHIDRVQKINLLCKKLNLKSQILTKKESIKKNTEIIIINSYGVMANYLSHAKSIFIGKSMIKKLKNVGGQNPIEAAKLGCKIYHGPYVYNFQEIYETFNKYKISEKIKNVNGLSKKIIIDLNNKKKNNNKNIKIINNLGRKILSKTYNEFNKILKNENLKT